MAPETHPNLMAGGKDTLLPDDPARTALNQQGGDNLIEVVRANPTSSLCWALLAEDALAKQLPEADVTGYAYARTGYHRGLDALRRNGWKGSGPVPWSHQPNQGFLRCLHALAVAADRIGEDEEAARCAQFLRDSSEDAHQVLVEQAGGEQGGADRGGADEPEEPSGE